MEGSLWCFIAEDSQSPYLLVIPFVKYVAYTAHLDLRLELRGIPTDNPRVIVDDPDERYWDVAEGRHIAVKRLLYLGSTRPLMIASEETELKIIM